MIYVVCGLLSVMLPGIASSLAAGGTSLGVGLAGQALASVSEKAKEQAARVSTNVRSAFSPSNQKTS